MKRRYVTADVFTDTKFKGNPLAVVLDAEGLSADQMQRLAAEFGYSETTFILPPRDTANTAWVRIFTPDREIPFAGHPNIGSAFVLAEDAAIQRRALPDTLIFEELAGLVPLQLWKEGNVVIGAELLAPEPLSLHATVQDAQVADCLSLDVTDIRSDTHPPRVASVGLPFLVVELRTRDALRRCMPNLIAFRTLLPKDGAFSIYVYTRDVGPNPVEAACDLSARMFTSRMTEDPATGSATSAAAGMIAAVQGVPDLKLRIAQGVDMGRASVLMARVETLEGQIRVRIGGRCVRVMEGSFFLTGR